MAALSKLRKGRRKDNPWPTNYVDDVTFALAAEDTNMIAVTVTAKDEAGNAIAFSANMRWYFATLATGLVLATAPNGGVAAGASGLIVEEIADRSGHFTTSAAGVAVFNVTDSGTPTLYLIVVLPDGRLKASSAITFA